MPNQEAEVVGLQTSPSIPRQGGKGTRDEYVAQVNARFPGKPFCLVEQWTIFRADLTPEEEGIVSARGLAPLILFTQKVIEDSQGRFELGNWARSSIALSFDGVMFETRNTVYVLLGDGVETTASLKTIFSIF